MPKSNLCKPKIDKEEQILSEAEKRVAMLIWGAIAMQDKDSRDIAKEFNMSHKTLYNRKNKPRSLTLEELFDMCNKLEIPLSELRHALFGEK